MDRLMNFTMGFSLLLILLVLRSVRRAHIRVEYSVSWLGAALALLAISRSRWALDRIAAFTGIADPPLALVFAVGCLFLIVFYRFSIIISDLKDANIALAQRLAILEYHLREGHESRQSQAAQ